MEEGLKVILSADVTAFQEAFVRAANTTKQQVTAINNTLSSTGRSAETAALSFEKFVGQRMGAALKQFGTQGAAIRAVAAEWAVYSQAVGQAGQSGRGIEGTAAAVQKVAAAMGLLQGVTLPSTTPLVNGLEQAEAALKRFSAGTMTVREVNGAIVQLIKSKEGLSNTAAIDALITKLTALKDTARETAATGLTIDPQVNVADTLRDVERIKGVIGSQRFSFTLTADARPLNASVLSAASATKGAVDEIKSSLYLGELAFEEMTQKAQRSVISYVRAVSQLKTVPIDLRTTVQATDYSGVIKSIQDVKAKIASASFEGLTFTKLPTLTLSADTTQFRQNLLQTKAVSEETWQAIRQNFAGVDKAIADAAAKSRLSVQQLLQNFNALKGVGPNAVVTTVVPPNFGPVVAAARQAKRQLDQTFLTPLPPIKMPAGASQTFNALGKGSNEAQQALINLSRVAQDAPYGFIGIANNINPLLESFQRLKASTGSTSIALRALGSSLMGPAGLGLMVGLASSLLVVFGDKIFQTKDKAQKMRDELQKAKDAAENFVESLDLIAKTRLKGEMAAQQELVALKLLYEASQNQNLSLADRKKAVDQLQQQYPAYFKNLKDEAILAGAAKGAYDELTQAILRKAKAESAQKELSDLTSEERRLRAERKQAAQETLDAAGRIKKAQDDTRKAAESGSTGGFGFQGYAELEAQAQDEYTQSVDRSRDATNKLNKNLEAQARLVKEIQGYGIDGVIDPTKTTPEIKPKANTKDAEDALKKLEAYVKGLQLDAQVDVKAVPTITEPTNWVEEWKESLKQQFAEEIDATVTLNLTPEQIKANALTSEVDKVFTDMMAKFREEKVKFPEINLDEYVTEGGAEKLLALLSGILKKVTDWREKFREAMTSGVTESVSAFAEGIGEALAGGNLKGAFEGVLSALGNAIQQMGKQMILGSAIIQKFKASLNTLFANPAGGLAVGAAMVAIGAAIKASASQLPKFADGGIVFGPTVGLMGEYAGASSNPEVIAPLSKLKDMIRGAGGATAVNVNGSWEVSGDKLRLVLARSNRKSGRYN